MANDTPRLAPPMGDGGVLAVAGFVLYAPKHDVIYRNHLYENAIKAQLALESIVWHNRQQYVIRAVYLGGSDVR